MNDPLHAIKAEISRVRRFMIDHHRSGELELVALEIIDRLGELAFPTPPVVED